MASAAHDMVSNNLRALTEWSVTLRSADLPPAVLRRAALILLDDFGALVAARDEPELVQLRRRIEAASGVAEATVFDGGARRLDRYSAALSNGSAASWCELDSGFRPVACHAALYVIPALLAEAEVAGAGFDDLLLALLVGYETVARVSRTFVFPPFKVHPHAALATIGAASAVVKLRGHDASLTTAAINSAATLVLPGPFKHAVNGALIRNIWPGLCAQNGLRAADWAAIGICGTQTSLSEVLSGVFGARIEAEALCADLGNSWAVYDGYHKMHACCQYSHSTVEAVLEALENGQPPQPADVRSIRVETHENARNLDNPEPATTLAAKFSIQHIVAASLTFGHANASAFHARELTNPEMVMLRRKVEVAPFEPIMPSPNDRPSRVTVTLQDGRQLIGECLSAQGGMDRPFAEEQILQKIRANIEAAYPGASQHLLPLIEEPHTIRTSWCAIVAKVTGAGHATQF